MIILYSHLVFIIILHRLTNINNPAKTMPSAIQRRAATTDFPVGEQVLFWIFLGDRPIKKCSWLKTKCKRLHNKKR